MNDPQQHSGPPVEARVVARAMPRGGVAMAAPESAASQLSTLFGLAATPGSLGQYLEKKLLDMVFGATAFGTIPATVYVALLSDSNTDAQRAAGTYTELANSNGYARTAITNNGTNWGAASGGSPATKANLTAVTPPTPTGALWLQINGILITDSATIGAGNILATGSLTVPVAAAATAVQFPVGGLVISLL